MKTYTTFADFQHIITGTLEDAALAAHHHRDQRVVVLRDQTGQVVDLDLRGDRDDVTRALQDHPLAPTPDPPPKPRGRGRPKLGVVAKEVTLLPRHWDWLQRQPRSASATLRALIEAEIKRGRPEQARKEATHRAYGAMQALGEQMPDFEEASRALFAHDLETYEARLSGWPHDLRVYLMRLATPTP